MHYLDCEYFLITAYSEIEEPNERNSRLKEITKGMGESCGSTFLDQRFQALLEEKLGGEIENVSLNSMTQMMEKFIETIKVSSCESLRCGHLGHESLSVLY